MFVVPVTSGYSIDLVILIRIRAILDEYLSLEEVMSIQELPH